MRVQSIFRIASLLSVACARTIEVDETKLLEIQEILDKILPTRKMEESTRGCVPTRTQSTIKAQCTVGCLRDQCTAGCEYEENERYGFCSALSGCASDTTGILDCLAKTFKTGKALTQIRTELKNIAPEVI